MPSRRQIEVTEQQDRNGVVPGRDNGNDGPRPFTGRGPSSFQSESFKDAMGDLAPALLRRLERSVRSYRRDFARRRVPRDWLVKASSASFQLDGLALTESEVAHAVRGSALQLGMSSARVLRARNHLAILRAIQRRARHMPELDAASVVRWYTSIGCGLSTAGIAPAKVDRLTQLLRSVNSATTRPPQAVYEAACVHVRLISEALFPGFNGVVARLMLQYQLMRAGLPPVVFDASKDRDLLARVTERGFYVRLMELVSGSCEGMAGPTDHAAAQG